MPIDRVDIAEVRRLHVDHPSQAATLLGRKFVSPWFTMDHERTELWERGVYLDELPNPYFEQGYGDGLVEGFHLVGMIDFLTNQVLSTGGQWVIWNYGLDRVRFVSVIRETDRFRLTGAITDVTQRAQGHLVTTNLVGEVDGRVKPGFVATQLALWTTVGETASPDDPPSASASISGPTRAGEHA